MVVGILGAVAQADIKRMLSFTLVSHIGYMIFGIALAHAAGLGRRDLLRRRTTSPIQTTLFLVAGLVERAGRHAPSLRPARRAGRGRPAAGGAVLRPGDEPGRHPAVLRVPRQARPARGRRRGRRAAARWLLVAGGVADQPAHPVRDRPGVEPGVLAAGRRRSRSPTPRRPPRATPAGREPGARTRAAPTRHGRRAWSAAWQRHEDVATAATTRPPARAAAVRALRPLPGVMVGATAAMVAVTVALTVHRRPAVRRTPTGPPVTCWTARRTSPRSSTVRSRRRRAE